MTEDDKTSASRTEKLRQAVAAAPDSAKAHFRLGTHLIRQGHGQEAEAELRRAVELQPDLAEAWVNLGGLLFSRFDFKGPTRKPEVVISALAPGNTERMVPQVKGLGIEIVWMPPGCWSEAAIEACRKSELKYLHGVCPVGSLKMIRLGQ